MKKITIENFDGQTVIMANKIISMTDTILTYEPKRNTRGAIAIDNSAKVTIEDYKEPRNWIIVTGISSEAIYATNEACFDEESQIKVQDLLTKQEAQELEDKINHLMDSYKF